VGSYFIRVQKEGYYPVEVEIEVEAGEVAELPFVLKRYLNLKFLLMIIFLKPLIIQHMNQQNLMFLLMFQHRQQRFHLIIIQLLILRLLVLQNQSHIQNHWKKSC